MPPLRGHDPAVPISSINLRRKAMNRYMTLGLSMLAGAALGAAAIQALHAQAKPIGYAIAQNVVTNEEGYTNEFLPQITKTIEDGGGQFLVQPADELALALQSVWR
jgi:hypothetical protein